jgi:hypothetical protein
LTVAALSARPTGVEVPLELVAARVRKWTRRVVIERGRPGGQVREPPVVGRHGDHGFAQAGSTPKRVYRSHLIRLDKGDNQTGCPGPRRAS